MRGRADFCVKNILSRYVIAWRGETFNQCLTTGALVMILVGVVVSKGAFLAGASAWVHKWISAILLAGGQILLPMSVIQCAWFSPEGQDSGGKSRYLWIAHPPDWQWNEDDSRNSKARNEEFEEDVQRKQDELEQRISIVDDRLISLDEKMDQLINSGRPQSQESSGARRRHSVHSAA